MTNGQIAQLQDLSKCYMGGWSYARHFVEQYKSLMKWLPSDLLKKERLTKWQKGYIRRLTHLYRHQIKAIKRNQT